jgi:hypothetical protein
MSTIDDGNAVACADVAVAAMKPTVINNPKPTRAIRRIPRPISRRHLQLRI